MKNVTGDLWTYEPADARLVTTNGQWTNHARAGGNQSNPSQANYAIMGGGCARECVDRFPWTPFTLGRLLEEHGNHVYDLTEQARLSDAIATGVETLPVLPKFAIVSFPTIEQLGQGANLDTIVRSCHELMHMADGQGWQHIILPRPGVGLGGLKWEDVEPVIAEILDDRVAVITFA